MTAVRLRFIFLLVLFFILAGQECLGERRKRVLVLHSYHQGLEWTDNITKGIQSVFEPYRNLFEIHYEYLDTKRNTGDDFLQKMTQFIATRNANLHYEVIIVADNSALGLVNEGRIRFQGNPPVVFCGINNYTPNQTAGIASVTGVAETTDYQGTIDTMMRLHPNRRHLIVILDRTPTGDSIRKEFEQIEPLYGNKLKIDFYRDFLLDEIPETFSHLSDNDFIYILTFNRDRNNTFISYSEGIEMLSRYTNVPMYGSWDFYLGKGIVGGLITSGVLQGQEAGKLALDILQGAKANDLAIVTKSPTQFVFDFKYMNNFGIHRSQLPKNSLIINAPPSPYERYRSLLYAVTLASLIAAFVLFLRYKKQQLILTEQKLKEDELTRYRDHLEETVQKRTEELRLARDAAETANKAKSAFLANMSHELRTPLNAILGFSQLMRQDSRLEDNQRETLNIINRSGEHLLKLINDVLEIAKIEAGKLQLEISTLDLHDMVRGVIDMMQLRAEQKGLQLELDQSSNFPRFIKGDEARLRQILVNLVSNAVKFTVEGSVTVRLGVKDNERQHLLLDIKDTGPGISAEDQNKLFKPFMQLAEGANQGGTGLGLAITRQFVQLMGGCVTVQSASTGGSLFHVDLPLESVSEPEISRLSGESQCDIEGLAPGQPAYKILIAEDHRDNQLLLTRLMTDLGLEVRVAENGEACVELFKAWHPDLIWMDRRMPVMDGIAAAQRIRQLPGGDRVKIVAVTASVFKEQEPEILAAGMNDYIRKPYLFRDIYNCLARQLRIRYRYKKSATRSETPVNPSLEDLVDIDVNLRSELRVKWSNCFVHPS